MKKTKHKTNWLVDILLFGGFLLSYLLDFTGLSLHQWLGIAVGMIAIYHLFVHWDWVEAVTTRFLLRTSNQARLYYLVDATLLFSFLLILETGLIISTWFSLPLSNYTFWKDFHVVVSLVTLMMVVVKIGIHWRWVINTAKRYIFRPAMPLAPKSEPTPSRVTTERRDFLRLMGIVGAAALLATFNALDIGEEGLTNASNSDEKQSSTLETQDQLSFEASTSSSDCVARCNKHCSYPGHCRRYTDTNQNNLCDLGECI